MMFNKLYVEGKKKKKVDEIIEYPEKGSHKNPKSMKISHYC